MEQQLDDPMKNYSLRQIKYLFSRSIEDKFSSSMKPEYEQEIIKHEKLEKLKESQYGKLKIDPRELLDSRDNDFDKLKGRLSVEPELYEILNDLKKNPDSLINQEGRKYTNNRVNNFGYAPMGINNDYFTRKKDHQVAK